MICKLYGTITKSQIILRRYTILFVTSFTYDSGIVSVRLYPRLQISPACFLRPFAATAHLCVLIIQTNSIAFCLYSYVKFGTLADAAPHFAPPCLSASYLSHP